MRTSIPLHTLVLSFVLLGCSTPGTSAFPTAEIAVGDERLTVWVADESDERRRGLMGMEQLPERIDGMLFAWPQPISASFHMRNTPLALEIWWFDSDGVLLGSTRMEPCLEDPCGSYGSPGPIMWALETPVAGDRFEVGARLSTIESS